MGFNLWYNCVQMELQEGQIIGSYRVVRELGRGGMASVYEVEHVKLGVRYALKTFTLQEGHVDLFRRRFSAEGKILARLNHPNLVRVIDLDFDEELGAPYYVMDLVLYKDGETHTLDDVEPGGADEEQIWEWFRQLCDALAYIHSQGIVHRDIKLNNVLIGPDRRVVLSDFGISKVNNESLRSEVDVTKTFVTGMAENGRLAMGTRGYMAPEVLRGEEVTPAADVYSLGVAFFRLLTNVWYDPCLAPKADGDSAVGMNSVKLLEPFEYRWVDVLPVMLSDNPSERPIDLSGLADRIRPPVQAPEPPAKKRTGLKIAVAVFLFALAASAAWWLLSSGVGGNDAADFDDLYGIPESVQEK